jgi:beta-glucosidase
MFAVALFCGLFSTVALHADAVPAPSPPVPLYLDKTAQPEARVNDLLQRLTQDEKLSMLSMMGAGPNKLNTPLLSRLNVPSMQTSDAPQGVRVGRSSYFPMGVVMASTWDPAVMGKVGLAIGQEAVAKQRQVIYGPDINIERSPQGGRDFEELGEDPFLSAQMGVAYIKGMQSQNVAACPKHFVCNDQEFHRSGIDIQVDERALHEIYLPPFEAAVKQAKAWAIMDSFNKVNGTFMTQNKPLLTDLLRTQWGWDGLMISDWGAVHDTVGGVNGGTDMEMPQPRQYAPATLEAALSSNQITQASIDEMVRRLIRLMLRTGLLNGPITMDPTQVNSPAHQALALKAAQEGITLLKNNNGILPLDRTKIKSIAVIGPNGQITELGGKSSAAIAPFYQVSVLDGVTKAAGPNITVGLAQGCHRFETSDPVDMAAAVDLATKSDVAIVVVGTDNTYEGEGLDVASINLPGDQEQLIEAVAAVNKHTIVVLNQGGPTAMDKWINKVDGVVEMWYAGEEQGNAVAQILFGDVNPSGKLPVTIGVARADYSDADNYPGPGDAMKYTEGIYVGYRHFDKQHIIPLFPFGFGLSYTQFTYDKLTLPKSVKTGKPVNVAFTLQNVGKVAGDEIAEVYVRPVNPTIDRPIQELKGFQRVSLAPKQKTPVSVVLGPNSFAYWDTVTHAWKTDPGKYEIDVSSSSRNIRLRGIITVN